MSTEWITPGVKVASYHVGGSIASVRLATIERLTATQIILDDGRRFRRDSGQAIKSDGMLLPLDDPRVVNARVNAQIQRLNRRLHVGFGAYRGNTDAALALLDDIASLVSQTRINIANLTGGSPRAGRFVRDHSD